jgi:hypothetical protein
LSGFILTENYSTKTCLPLCANPLKGKWLLANSPDRYWFSSYRFYEMNVDEFGFTYYLEDC